MNLTSSTIETRALRLALVLAASEGCRISRKALDDHFGSEAGLLIDLGLLVPDGHVSSIATEDDIPATVEWSAERGCFGYFSESDGWVAVPDEDLASFTLQIRPLARRLTSQLNLYPKDRFAELSAGLIWEVGACMLPGHAKRVSLWVARRLHDPDAWSNFVQQTQDRPAQELRMVLHLAENEVRDAPFVANHAIVSVVSVLSAGSPFEIEPQIAAARLKRPTDNSSPVSLSADGGHLTVHGNSYTFRGVKQRAIVRFLYEAWERGEAPCLTEEVLLEAGSGDSVRRLARAFNGHRTWHEVIKEANGVCWLEI